MKYLSAIIIILILFICKTAYSQNWESVDPKMASVLLDTTLVKATLAVIEPGAKSNSHTHYAHFFYALTDGKIKVHYTDGTSVDFELKAGEYGYSGPEKLHQTENTGSNTLKFLLIELKEHPFK